MASKSVNNVWWMWLSKILFNRQALIWPKCTNLVLYLTHPTECLFFMFFYLFIYWFTAVSRLFFSKIPNHKLFIKTFCRFDRVTHLMYALYEIIVFISCCHWHCYMYYYNSWIASTGPSPPNRRIYIKFKQNRLDFKEICTANLVKLNLLCDM